VHVFVLRALPLLLLLLLQEVPATVMEYTTTDISAALSIAGVQVKSGSSKRVSSSGATQLGGTGVRRDASS
jgi:hypothetical protein